MRRHLSTHPAPLRALLGALLCLALVSAPSPALADVTIEIEGRDTRTGPKLPLREINGVALDPMPDEAPRRASGRKLGAAGRGLRSRPTLPVSVGVSGCPGCLEVLAGAVVVVDTPPRGLILAPSRDSRPPH